MAVKLNKGQSTTVLNLTALIDVLLFLMVFFLVSTKYAEEDEQLSVLLPNASEARPQIEQPKAMVINIDQKGNYFVGRAQLTPAELDRALQQAKVDNPTRQAVTIRADKRVIFDAVVQAVNLCRKNRIENYSFDTQ